MMKRNLILCIVIISLFLSGCYSPQGRYYNNDEKVVGESDSYDYSNRKGEIKDNEVSLEISFSGFDTIWTIEAFEDTELKCSYEAEITRGDFKVVLISPDKEITSTIEGGFDDEIVFNLEKGTNIIKIVGNNAKGSFKIRVIDEDEDMKNITIKANTKEKFPLE